MTAKNDITGDTIQSKVASDLYRENWEKIFMPKPDDSVFLVINDDYALIIADWKDNQNNMIRLNRAQYNKLRTLILTTDAQTNGETNV